MFAQNLENIDDQVNVLNRLGQTFGTVAGLLIIPFCFINKRLKLKETKYST